MQESDTMSMKIMMMYTMTSRRTVSKPRCWRFSHRMLEGSGAIETLRAFLLRKRLVLVPPRRRVSSEPE